MKVGVDTNVLVRSFVDDGTAQFRAAARVLRENKIVVPASVLLECEWVLRDVFKLARNEVAAALEGLLGAANVTILQAEAVASALEAFRKGCDFADAFHLVLSPRVDAFVTFDRAFARRAAALSLTPSVQLLAASP